MHWPKYLSLSVLIFALLPAATSSLLASSNTDRFQNNSELEQQHPPQSIEQSRKENRSKPRSANRAAQESAEPDSPSPKPDKTSESSFEQQRALSLLDQLADSARSFSDREAGARTQARVADLLWSYDRAKSRQLFRQAFQSIVELDSRDKKASATSTTRARLKAEVLRMIARRDAKLARELIDSGNPAETEAGKRSYSNINERYSYLLDLAEQFLDENRQLSITFADQSINEVSSPQLVSFLNRLRRTDAPTADYLFDKALTMLARSATPDTNGLLLLGGYLFPPGTVSVVQLAGIQVVSITITDQNIQPDSAEMLRRYLDAAFSVLVRPLSQSGAAATVQATISHIAIQQLLPLFQRYSPGYVSALNIKRRELAQAVPLALLDPRVVAQSSADETSVASNQTKTAIDPKQRNINLFNTARNALYKGEFERARSLAAQLSDEESKRRMLTVIDFEAARARIRAGELADAYNLIRGDIDVVLYAVIFIELADAYVETGDRFRAIELLNEAESKIVKAETGARKAYALAGVANTIAPLDSLRGFEVMQSAIKAVNDSTDFDPSREIITYEVKIDGARFETGVGWGGTLSLDSGLARLAQNDFDRAVWTARSLEREAIRAAAILAICRSVLMESKTAHGLDDRSGNH